LKLFGFDFSDWSCSCDFSGFLSFYFSWFFLCIVLSFLNFLCHTQSMLLSDSHISYAGITLLNISFEGIFFLRFKELPIFQFNISLIELRIYFQYILTLLRDLIIFLPILCYECLGYDFNIRVYLILYCCAVFILYTSGNLRLKFFVQYCGC
jgi:hypothetical protein